MTAAAERNRGIVRDAFDACAGGRGDIFDLLADNAVWTIPGSTQGAGTWRGRQAYVDSAVTPLFDHLAAATVPRVIGTWADGDEVIVRWEQDTPTRRGELYRNHYAWFLTMCDGKATAVTVFLDLHAYEAAMGEAW